MRREYIRCTDDWRKTGPRYDIAYLNRDPELPGMRGIDVMQIRLFFSFSHKGKTYPCALVHWFKVLGQEPDGTSGMWIVQQESDLEGNPVVSIIHLDCIIRACHLTPLFGRKFIQCAMQSQDSLTAFKFYYVNRYIDHHAFQLAF
jgi:hypothetical protein